MAEPVRRPNPPGSRPRQRRRPHRQRRRIRRIGRISRPGRPPSRLRLRTARCCSRAMGSLRSRMRTGIRLRRILRQHPGASLAVGKAAARKAAARKFQMRTEGRSRLRYTTWTRGLRRKRATCPCVRGSRCATMERSRWDASPYRFPRRCTGTARRSRLRTARGARRLDTRRCLLHNTCSIRTPTIPARRMRPFSRFPRRLVRANPLRWTAFIPARLTRRERAWSGLGLRKNRLWRPIGTRFRLARSLFAASAMCCGTRWPRRSFFWARGRSFFRPLGACGCGMKRPAYVCAWPWNTAAKRRSRFISAGGGGI